MTSVRVEHPLAHLLAPVPATYAAVLAGRWSIAADLWSDRLRDPAATAAALDLLAVEAGVSVVPEAEMPVVGDVDDGGATITFDTQDLGYQGDGAGMLAGMLDLFSRLHSGQWAAMVATSRSARGSYPHVSPDVEERVLALREQGALAQYRTGHPYASFGVAESNLEAKVAYHAWKALGGGTTGGPTFGLPNVPGATQPGARAPRTTLRVAVVTQHAEHVGDPWTPTRRADRTPWSSANSS